jgi:hypothetical protein
MNTYTIFTLIQKKYRRKSVAKIPTQNRRIGFCVCIWLATANCTNLYARTVRKNNGDRQQIQTQNRRVGFATVFPVECIKSIRKDCQQAQS